MRRIYLGKGHFATVDIRDYATLNQYKWYCDKGYAVRVICKRLDGKLKLIKISMHAEILRLHGINVTCQIDHKNRRRRDNRFANLRPANHQQQAWNRSVRRDSISGVKGVCVTATGRISAMIMVEGKIRRLGDFKSVKMASRAYKKAARFYFGAFASV